MARPCLQTHPKFRRLVFSLKVPVPHAVGYLECLWIVAYECGDPFIGDATDVELAAQWPGKPGQLCEALLKCGGQGRSGFIEQADDRDGFRVHDLFDHCPDYVKRRNLCELERRAKKTCGHCGVEFQSPKKWAKFCTDACRIASHRTRHDDGDETECNEDVTHGNESIRYGNVRATEGNATPAPAPAPSINTGSSLREKPKRARSPEKFQKPTVEEIRAYCTERENSVDAERFHDHYESNGWRVGGKSPMKCWKAAVRTWERNGINANGQAASQPGKKRSPILTSEEIDAYNRGKFDPDTRTILD